MESTVFWLRITPIENQGIPQEFYFGDCFSIIFNCTQELIQITQGSDVEFSSTTTTEAILVPSDILLPASPELLDQILPAIGETARRILSREGCDSNTLEIVVNLHVVTRRNIVQDSDIYNDDLCENVPELAQLVNLLERSKIDEQDDDAECAICLEKFGHGNEDSSVEVVRINCSHVFHDRCMLRWLRCCADHQSPYSCPLCRCLISPTSHGDDE
ncbi:hypothetical protein HN51_049992 [Arachis hypogaea]|uniref:RING-type domain-containing protein n=1 Tax=Arachis hypogaea TaxID=3818 RepID=A0A444YD91_ARAHY|nr:uncharacterized protein LOC112762799 [Arachis hypogaea]QHN91630.1 E3 ubiquitin-protein ligase RHA2A [Arachis hypogaea]RYQ99876.1 hypothetical protein Ahy_B07g087887 [Arachis hypogaea]RYQ99877.1 hypothetical protein Ahy_B07g087888 [Arachis hypogaea]RYQ99880.1 hypothetical protein Ahy_B07g087893 [Arachis hypogaea]